MPSKNLVPFFILIFLVHGYGICQNIPETSRIIPIPSSATHQEGQFILNDATGIQYDEKFKLSADFLTDYIESGSRIRLKNNDNILFLNDPTIQNPEGYRLEINPKQIIIRANSETGAFYAVQSLRQLLPISFENDSFKEKEIAINCLTIMDEPQFPYRGMHLDVVRHFFPLEFIKKYIDAMALLKLNTFHWHLTDDQGWRIEIKSLPKLQEISAYRKETLIGHYNTEPQQFNGKRYGGYYTQDEIKELVDYASKRQITIIPEIEMPGHARAAIAAYPELGCTGETMEVATKWGVFEEVFCPKESTFEFLETVLDEVVGLFPSEYIHIGGDEAPKTNWKKCSHCQKLIKDKNLKEEHELQSYFITKIENYLNQKGRKIIGWDEILEGGLAPNATVMSWRGVQGAIDAAKQHHQVIMTPNSHLYFDYYQSENEEEPLAIGGFVPLKKVYDFHPIPAELNKEEAKYVLGAQANLWTEYIPDSKQAEYMAFPRMLALSEVVWSKLENRNYEDFLGRVEHFQKRLEALDINYANHLYEVEGQVSMDGYQLTTALPNKIIKYTLDGTQPTINSRTYEEPIPFDENFVVNAAVFDDGKQLGRTFSEDFNRHKAVGKTITMNVEPHKAYSGSGKNGLINGIQGSDSRYGDKEWLGFWGDDLEITIDLGKKMEVNTIETRFYDAPGQWIYAPELVELILDDGRKIAINEIPKSENSITKLNLEVNAQTRYLSIFVKNYGIIPDGKQGAGNKAWTFIDEIIIK